MITEKKLKNGFLDEELVLEVNKIRNKNKELYLIIEKINSLLYEIENNYEKDDGTNVELYVFTTFSQIHISIQSYIILLERGLYDDAQIVLRSTYDKLFKCLYVLENDKALDILDQDNVNSQLTLYKYILNNKLFDYVPEEKLKVGIQELEKRRKLKDNGKIIKCPDNKDISEKLNLPETYIHYKILSHYTHNSVFVINSKLIETDAGYLINQNIQHGNFKDEVIKAIICLGYIISPICDYLGLENIKKEFDNEVKNLLKL